MAYVSRSSEQASIFPPNNLPADSKVWGQNIEKRLFNIETNFNAAEVNNLTRDSQLISSYTRLDIAVTKINQILSDLGLLNDSVFGTGGLEEAIINVTDVVLDPIDNTKINGLNLKAGTVVADNVVSSYVYAGSIAANQISAGEVTGLNITGGTLSTAGSRHVSITGTSALFYDESGNWTGTISAQGTSRGATLTLNGPGSGQLGVYSDGFFANATGGSSLALESGVLSLGNAGISITNGGVTTNGGSVSVGNGTVSTNGCTMGSSNISASGTVSGGTVSASNFSGTYNTTIAGNTTSSFAGNVFINTSGNMFRSTATSSREAKDNIQPYTFDTDAFISVSPVTFNYKPDAVSDQEETQISQLGFILEDFEDAGVGEYLTIPTNEMDKYKGLRYDKLYMLLHKVVQEQNETIKNLTARIEALEA